MSSGGFASQNGAGGSYTNGPSQNPVGVYPSNQSFMAPPLPGYMNSLPTKGPPPAGPSCYSGNRHQPSPVGTPGALPASPSHRMGPPQASATPPPPSSYSQHPQQPSSWSGVTPAPAGNHVSPAPYASGTSTPPVFQNTMQPPAALQHAPPALNVMAPHQPYGPPPAFGPPAAMRGTPPPPVPPPTAVPPPPLAPHSEAGLYLAQPAQMNRPTGSSYPSLQPAYHSPPAPAPQQQQHYPQPSVSAAQLSPSLAAMSLQSQPPEALRVVNLLQERSLLPAGAVTPPAPCLPQDLQKLNCSPEVFRCTLTSIPQTQSLLNKAKLPLGLLLHPFKDLSLPVVTSSNIVRCRSCRTYINPFVSFVDARRWKCNLCHRVNDVPEEFMYNPVSRSYGAPHKRPEVQNATIEFIAPSEYMLRPPQPAVYLFVLDVSHNAVETGYLDVVCQSLLDNLDSLPGDTRTKIGFITFDSTIHFYNLQEGLSQPQMLIVSDIDDVFLPTPDSLLVNLNECRELVQDLLASLPQMFSRTMETQSGLGPALQAAFKLLSPTGGRMSVFQTQLPTVGIGALKPREEPNQRAPAKDVQNLSPATDFYKKLALDCSGHHVAVDLFLLSAQYCDLSSLGCISRYSAGSVYFYPSYHKQHNPSQTERFQKDLKRYLTRKIGFEAVMRIRCTKGLSMHTFHGNFFVRSTDLLSLANVNPDAGFAVQMSIEENLLDLQVVSFQAALLYTSSKGERRIRVHTLCLPVVNSLSDIFAGADVQAITALLASMAVDRSVTASLGDARDALINAAIDTLASYRSSVLSVQQPGLLAPACLRLFPLYILALLKHKAFRTSAGTRLDERVFAMCQLKCQPLAYLMLMVHPSLYRVDNLSDEGALNVSDRTIPQPRALQLSVEKLNRDAAFLMDCGTVMYLWIGRNCNPVFLTQVLGVDSYAAVPLNMNQLPELDTAESSRIRALIDWLRERRPFHPVLHIIRDESPLKADFMQNMIEDLSESALSYYEFLLHLQQQICK
ncbi:protein transport protein Sec24A isoform X3 [Ctenopharyngodon idella]|uniref:protein transport protein Sec24A isoform X3 n=1 Tax=Ctenopharyngodon idella TaxID=7959 RepID=UPI002230B826|nr:protein transport protein Sec24A isoform X3 [Ctenopharyngodon idella]